MHIHPPKGAVHSIRHFLMELFTVTCGILIALSLEGLVESMHHRSLLKKARESITAECRDNRKDLESVFKDIPRELASLDKLVDICGRELARRGSVDLAREGALDLSLNATSLGSSAWSAASSSGAVTRMPLEEIKTFTRVYELQSTCASLQQQVLMKWMQVIRFKTLLKPGQKDLKGITADELADIRRNASEAYVTLQSFQECGNALVQSCEAALAIHR